MADTGCHSEGPGVRWPRHRPDARSPLPAPVRSAGVRGGSAGPRPWCGPRAMTRTYEAVFKRW